MLTQKAPLSFEFVKAKAHFLAFKFAFQAYFKPYAMKQFSPLEKKRLKRFKFLKWITLAE
ncbi:hypothetical protein EKP33_04470 [Campylobacter upsaliensis]|nr:hypothetical protein [Campylobacter upsaliensis]